MLPRQISRPTVFLVLVLGALLACSRKQDSASRGPWLEAGWTGSDTGRISAPAIAEWCDSLGVLEIRALQGDSGLALAIYSAGQPPTGRYRVGPPQRTDSTPPGAAMALRWFAETAIKGFRGDRGEVQLQRSTAGVLSGSFDAHLTAVNAADRLHIRGTFGKLRVSPAVRGCTHRPDRSAADTPDRSASDTGVN